eukprot:8351993-Pyramimonas_sp.AAC.1
MSNSQKERVPACDLDPRVRRAIKWALDPDQKKANNTIESIRLGSNSRAARNAARAHRTRRTFFFAPSVLLQAWRCPVSEAEQHLNSQGDQNYREQA